MSFCVRHHAHTTTTTTAFKSQTTTKTTNFVTAEYLFVSSNSRNRRRKRLVDVSSLREVGGGSMFLSRRQIRSVISRRRATCASSSPSSSSSSSTTPNREISNESASTSYAKNHRDVTAPFHPGGDQPSAIAKTLKLLKEKDRKFVSLRGATGTGKTFVVANVIAEHEKPVLVVVPNKTLAAQVARELRGYLRTSHLVELFVSHFSVYIPESCRGGRYVEKRSAVDPDLDALRHRATRALVEAKSTNRTPVIVASVSCLYGLGLPSDFVDAALFLGKDFC